MSTIPQLASLRQRLVQLNLQKARYGINAEPHIMTESSDLETLISQMELIDIQRRNLDHLVRQRDNHAGIAPVHVLNQIATSRAEIARLRQVCARLGQGVPSHPLDSDEQPELPPIQPRHTPAPQPAHSDIRSKLDQIERLINEIRASL